MSVYFKRGTKRNVIRHQGIPAMRSATLESLHKLPEAFSKGWNQLSMKQIENCLATTQWWCFELQHGKFTVFFQCFFFFLSFFYGSQFRTRLAMYQGADKSLARPGRKQATVTKLNFCKPLKKKIQEVVRSTRSSLQQWPPRRTKNGDLSIVFSVGSG